MGYTQARAHKFTFRHPLMIVHQIGLSSAPWSFLFAGELQNPKRSDGGFGCRLSQVGHHPRLRFGRWSVGLKDTTLKHLVLSSIIEAHQRRPVMIHGVSCYNPWCAVVCVCVTHSVPTAISHTAQMLDVFHVLCYFVRLKQVVLYSSKGDDPRT